MKQFILLSLIIILSACATSITLPLQGDFNKGQEKFLGQATGYIDGKGTLAMNTESGITCQGQFEYLESRVSGSGTFNCDDGRTGTFTFTSSGTTGMGFGKTNKGEPFKFTFGHSKITTEW
jgi:hypothetical protein